MIGFVGTREAFRYMGLLAVIGGIIYGLLHLLWLRKFDNREEEDMVADNGEAEKLTEPKFKDQGTNVSQERLCLMIKYNQIGSLASLPRGSKVRTFNNTEDQREFINRSSVCSETEFIRESTNGAR